MSAGLPSIIGEIGYILAQGGKALVIADEVMSESGVKVALPDPTLCIITDMDEGSLIGRTATDSEERRFPIESCRVASPAEASVLDTGIKRVVSL